MRESHLPAVGTGSQVGRSQGIVGTPAISPTFGYFSFWLWGHYLLLDINFLLYKNIRFGFFLETLFSLVSGCVIIAAMYSSVKVFFPSPHAQKSLHEFIQIPIQNSLSVTNLKIIAMVFYHLIWVQHIGTNLAAPFSLGVFAA